MPRKEKKIGQGKQQFKSVYCFNCQQKKSCGKLDQQKEYCCSCYEENILGELEQEGLLVNSAQERLANYRSGAIVCECLANKKPRIKYANSDGSGWTKCEKEGCKSTIRSAGHHGVIKNRNNPAFWGLEVPQKVLCGDCLKNLVGQMPPSKKYTFNKYLKRGVLGQIKTKIPKNLIIN